MAYTITIMTEKIDTDENNEPTGRTFTFHITDGSAAYVSSIGGQPLTGNRQTILDGIADEVWAGAIEYGHTPTPTEIEIVGAILWYKANDGAKADVFDKSISTLATDITAMVNASFAGQSQAIRTGWIRVLMSSLLDTRVNGHDRDLV